MTFFNSMVSLDKISTSNKSLTRIVYNEGWSSEIRSQKIDFIDVTQDGKHSVAVTTVVRITLQDGSFREDVGVGIADNLRSKGDAIEKARKSSVTDGMKRALRLFGNAMGLSIGRLFLCSIQ